MASSESSALAMHPAFVAWRALAPGAGAPKEIEVLKDAKTKVFRLKGTGPGDVIAKIGKRSRLKTERIVYEQILPHVRCSALRMHGCMDQGDTHSWMFMEAAEGESYDASNSEHRSAVAQWLAELHSSTLSEDKTALLPDRGVSCYYDYLHAASRNIVEHLEMSSFSEERSQSLSNIRPTLERVAAGWPTVELLLSEVPPTFVHGDLSSRHIMISGSSSSYRLFVFDWDTSGWGVPAIDLADLTLCLNEEDLKLYWSIVGRYPSHLSLDDIVLIDRVAKVLRLAACVYWATLSFSKRWINTPSGERTFDQLHRYQTHLASLCETLNW